MDTAAKVQAEAEDIYAQAQQINRDRAEAQEEEEFLDESELLTDLD